MIPTLEQLERAFETHKIPTWAARSVPTLRERVEALRTLRLHTVELRRWAEGERDRLRYPHNKRAFDLERQLADVLAQLVMDYRFLGLEVDPKLAALQSAWPQASEILHRHTADNALLGDKESELLEGLDGVVELPSQSDDPLIEAGRRIRRSLVEAKEIEARVKLERKKAEGIDEHAADAAHVAQVEKFESKGLVQYPSEDARPRLDPGLARQLEQAGILSLVEQVSSNV